MSADNYYLIRKDNFGFFVPVMGFSSNEDTPAIRLKHPRFMSIEGARNAVKDDWTEYGTSVHPECHDPETPLPEEVNGHVSSCPQALPEDYFEAGEWVCECEQLLKDWHTYVAPQDVDNEKQELLKTIEWHKERISSLEGIVARIEKEENK